MSDIKLFKLNTNFLEELESDTFTFERELQKLIEDNMEDILGIKFLESEYSTGSKHRKRIVVLGIDEYYCPVIIEYKRSANENVIKQGLYDLNWLMNNRSNYEILVQNILGEKHADNIEWSDPRLLCIAGDFTKYDKHAVEQMKRNIELIRYKKYGDNILLLEQVVAEYADTHNQVARKTRIIQKTAQKRTTQKTFNEVLSQADSHLSNLYLAVADFIESLGDDVQKKELKYYVVFKRIKNFTSLNIKPQKKYLLLWLTLNPEKEHAAIENGLVRDVSNIGHLGTGDLEATISNMEDLEKIKHLIEKSYRAS